MHSPAAKNYLCCTRYIKSFSPADHAFPHCITTITKPIFAKNARQPLCMQVVAIRTISHHRPMQIPTRSHMNSQLSSKQIIQPSTTSPSLCPWPPFLLPRRTSHRRTPNPRTRLLLGHTRQIRPLARRIRLLDTRTRTRRGPQGAEGVTAARGRLCGRFAQRRRGGGGGFGTEGCAA